MKWGARRGRGVEPPADGATGLERMRSSDPGEAPTLDFGPDPEPDVDRHFEAGSELEDVGPEAEDGGPELDYDRVAGSGRGFTRRGAPKLQTLQSLPLRLALGGGVVFVVGLLITAGAKSYRDLQIVRQREATLKVRIDASEQRLEELHHRLQLLSDDPATLERLAREELGLVGKDDIVFVLPPDQGSASTPP